ncbi:MAG: HYC_CC_PP family protein [Bacteroidales bacterium]
MKKAVTILITLVFFTYGMHISIDRHFCGGKLAAVKVSLTGEKASCGMEHGDSPCGNNLTLKSKCCEDQVLTLSGNSNYFPEYFRTVEPLKNYQVKNNQIIFSTEVRLSGSNTPINVFPPGKNLLYRHSQPGICVFRI